MPKKGKPKPRTKTVHRDSRDGKFISKGKAENKPKNTWEKERIKLPPRPRGRGKGAR